MAPSSIADDIVSFYVTKVEDLNKQNLLNQTIYYNFYDNGQYVAKFENAAFYSSGRYSYIKESPLKSHITFTDSKDQDVKYSLKYTMTFINSESGTWSSSSLDNPNKMGPLHGTFEIEAEALTPILHIPMDHYLEDEKN